VRQQPRHARSTARPVLVARGPARSRLRAPVGVVGTIVAVAVTCVIVAAPARASVRPAVTSLSRQRGPYWGATLVTVRGSNFADVQKVLFGDKAGYAVDVMSLTKLTVIDPQHKYGTVHVRVVTTTGASPRRAVDRFTFTRPTMDTPIMGGLTARQEQRISARIRATHRGVRTARASSHWTPAMGRTAMRRARSWLGLPYSWAGGNASGPTTGVCAHNGGDLDCHVVGFDCSGLALYAWSPYEQLVHYAATQHGQAGRFHPAIGQLMPGDLVFFSGYVANGIGHVAVYQGHGMVIEAAQSGTELMRSRLADVIAASGRYRGATRPMSTGRQGPAPRIYSVTKQIAASGGYVRITGRRLDSARAVYVGGVMVYRFAKRTASSLVVKVPPHAAGRVTIAVSNAWGTARRTITYVGAPLISSLSPSSGPTAGGTTVTVHGSFLDTVGRVKIGTKPVSYRVLGPHRLTFTTPTHRAGSVPVTAFSPFGVSNAELYTFAAPSPSPSPTSSSPTTSSPTSSSPTTSSPTSSSSSRAPRFPTRAPPTMQHFSPRRPATSGFYADRVGDGWFLIGRRFAKHSGPSARSCPRRALVRSTAAGCAGR
jgi:cell wall-associated NlpC family hydrolase